MTVMNEALKSAMSALDEATAAFEAARDAARKATAAETTAHNRLNSAQRRVDELLAGMRKAAPHGSDWNKPTPYITRHEEPQS